MKKKNNLLVLLSIIVVAAILVICREFGIVSTSKLLIVQYIGIYSIMVMGINIINGYMGTFSLAHAGLMAVGAYAAALTSRYLLKSAMFFPLTILIGGLAAAAVGLIVAIPSFKAKGDYLAIITLGFTLMIQSILNNASFIGASQGMTNISKYTNIYWVFIFLILSMFIVKFFINSKYGRSIKAIREDQVATQLSSVNVRQAKTVAFGVSAFLIGISGGLLCHLLGYTSPSSYGYTNVVDGLVMVYIGGVGSITGSVTGSIVWQLLVQLLKSLGTWRWVVGGLILCLVMIFMPRGVFGFKELPEVIGSIKNRLLKKKGAQDDK